MTGYWPWWMGSLALGTTTVAYALWTGHGLGVSGAWARVVQWRQQRRVEQLNAAFGDDDSQLRAALAAATAAQFTTASSSSDSAAAGVGGSATGGRVATAPRTGTGSGPSIQSHRAGTPSTAPERPMPLLCYAALLGSMLIGGFAGSLMSGRFDLRTDMGPGFREIVTGNPVLMTVLLFAGGVLVGFGTRMAGGCSSGHGLTGCSRLQPVSLLATPVFFGSAVVVSWLLWKVI